MKSLTPWEYIMAKRRFTLFPKLPTEIREAIWRMTLVPRLVEVWPKGGELDGFYSTTRLPSAMTACRDSRAAVLHLYPQCFGGAVIVARIRINFDLDTLFLDWKIQGSLVPFMSSITVQEANKMRYLAFDPEIHLGRKNYGVSLTTSKLKCSPELRDNVIVDHYDVKVEFEILEWLASAVVCMPGLQEITWIQEAWPMNSGDYQKHDEFAELKILGGEDEILDNISTEDDSDEDSSVISFSSSGLFEIMEVHLIEKFVERGITFFFRYGWRPEDASTGIPRHRFVSRSSEESSPIQ
ncbi:hypothetical protein NHQ30_004410 [Ciborinia camelliae]|nr:hypothetical protein NHQ30_004410 [Ciborinia camelliae]